MDKQKQIEEMARDFADPTYGCIKDCTSCKECILEGDCIVHEYAVAAYNAGYRKIPENAVVLTREEYDRLTNSEIGELVKENEELGKSNVGWSELYRRLKIKYQQARKETAEKFAEMVKERIYSHDYLLQDTDDLLVQEIYEICKEITEGKV